MTIEQAILEKVRSLPPEKQLEVFDFAESLVHEAQTTTNATLSDWQNSPSIGMWQDREDMSDSTSWVRQLRQQD